MKALLRFAAKWWLPILMDLVFATAMGTVAGLLCKEIVR
jgi:hypothetical protein